MLLNVIVALFILLEVIVTYKKLNKDIPWDALICVVVAAFILPKIVMTVAIIGMIYELATSDEAPEG